MALEQRNKVWLNRLASESKPLQVQEILSLEKVKTLVETAPSDK